MQEDLDMNNIEGILFDFDGVIGDTIGDLCKTWQMALRDFNVNIGLDDYPPLEGMDMYEIARVLGRKYGREFTDEECKKVKETKDRYYLENCKFKFFPEVYLLVDYLLKSGKRLVIVTASPREKVERTVSSDFLGNFEAVVTMEDTQLKKPNPEPYFAVMKKLNLSADKCVVIENAPYGITSAKWAGIYCIALATTMSKEYLKEADKVFSNHSELLEFLKRQSENKI